jgi:hypothetical protein
MIYALELRKSAGIRIGREKFKFGTRSGNGR